MKVLILCGGKGLRLRPLTDEIPKPMVYLKDKPLVEHIVDYFANRNFKDFIFTIGYKGEIIKNYFKNKKENLNIEYVDSGDVDSIQRIYDTREIVSDTFLVLYGDAIANIDIEKLLEFHKKNDGLVTITTHPMKSPFGHIFSDDNNIIKKFKEKPVLDYWVNIGFMVFDKNALEYIDKDDNIISFFNKLIKDKKLFEFKHNGKHITVNNEQEKVFAEKEIDGFYTYIEGG